MLSRMIQLGFIQAIVLCNPVHSSDLYEYVKCQVCEVIEADPYIYQLMYSYFRLKRWMDKLVTAVVSLRP